MGTRTERETVLVATRVPPELKDELEAAAAECGLPLSTWLRIVAYAAAGISPLRDHLSKASKAARAEERSS